MSENIQEIQCVSKFERILNAATEVFAESGFHQCRVSKDEEENNNVYMGERIPK
ncbi:hypothetical protein [Desulfosporosinus lacus]|uniref:Uncharacterized protein n=1 Tax=Desulfosporosinus lacus DSM 15449 TaxID=1121420 RepID=A0A1M5YBI8_9FIRM|nr:hypothetical protein [Desulfosporosinus lacus]SHI09346.1 hypothetical protein SAMN02746098_02415 [Desulfosporosinus lacus DSM 15449]